MFSVIKSLSEGYTPSAQECSFENIVPTTNITSVSVDALSRPGMVDTALRFLCSMFFDKIHNVIFNLCPFMPLLSVYVKQSDTVLKLSIRVAQGQATFHALLHHFHTLLNIS